MINTLPKPPHFWRRHAPLPPAEFLTEASRRIPDGPLLDLAEIQGAIAAGEFSGDCVWVATEKADDDLYKLQWDEDRVCDLICALDAADYRNSEWCQSSSKSKHACDSYVVRFDDEDGVRDSRAPEYYLKFSLNATGLTICLISCHLSE